MQTDVLKDIRPIEENHCGNTLKQQAASLYSNALSEVSLNYNSRQNRETIVTILCVLHSMYCTAQRLSVTEYITPHKCLCE